MPGPQMFGRRGEYCLNYKGLQYQTEWLELPDIEAHHTKLSIAPTSQKPNGSPRYTLPAIHDTSTGAYVSDSFAIALYLEETYPNTPSVFPYGTAGLQASFESALMGNMAAVWPLTVVDVANKLNPASDAYFRQRRAAASGDTLEKLLLKGEEALKAWKSFEEGMSKVDAWYAKNKSDGPFLLGEKLTWADIVVCSLLQLLRGIWESDKKWREIESWNGGRWKVLMQRLAEYEEVA